MRVPVLRLAILLGATLASPPRPAAAQFGVFGQNKIQFRHFDWHVLHGAHVDLYFYPEEAELAHVALAYAEQSYDVLAVRFRHTVTSRIPLIVYASHQDFEQTNVLPFVPPEGLLGVTEFLKNRVAVPFTGSYADFRHSLRHELVHVFEISKATLTYDLYPRQRRVALPLWWDEGLAEYWSAGEDSRDSMILRDVTVSGRLPTIEQLNNVVGGIVYPMGGALVRYLATTYGDWRIVELYDDLWKYTDFADLMKGVFGRTLAQLTTEWRYAMRREYYPSVAEQRPLALDAHKLASLAVKPVVWTPPGDSAPEVLYLSPRTGYTSIYAVPLDGGKARTVVTGERSAEFESFHPFESRLDVSPGGVAVFASKYLDRDALVFWDLVERRLVGRYQFPDLVAILSPSWSPDGRSVVFEGLAFDGYADLYLLHLGNGGKGTLERLTADRYLDADPSFSPDGREIVFSSDRTAYGATGAVNLFVLDLATHSIRYLTYGPWRDESPRWSAATGRVTFTSDRGGAFDVYSVDSTGAGRRETAVAGGAFDAEWVPAADSGAGRDGGRYVVGGFEDLSFNIYAVRPTPDTAAADTVTLAAAPAPSGWRWPELDDTLYARAEAARYREHYTLDFAAAAGLVAPGYAAAQGAAFLLSDMLSDHVFYLDLVSFQEGNGLGDFVSNINGTVLYLNQAQRLNWGLGAFRRRGLFYEGDFEQIYSESSYGGFVELRYPLSRFTRVETQFGTAESDRTDYSLPDPVTGVGFLHRRGLVTSNYLSFVHDNSLWQATGPIDGGVMNLTAGVETDFQNARFDSYLLSADVRRYFRTGLHSAVAVRGYGFYSGGEFPQRVAIGGSWAVRGYPQYAYVAGDRAVMGNVEWRFPVTDYLSVGFPFGELRFPGIEGALFTDLGRAWSERSAARGWLGSYGVGLRMSLLAPLVLRLDLGWRYALGNRELYSLPFNYRGSGFAAFWFGFDY